MPTLPRRVDFQDGFQVRLRSALNAGKGKLMTLSEGGAYIATGMNLLPQAQLRVAVDVPELRRTLEIEALVAWENRGPNRPSAQPDGYGLRFTKVSAASREAIRWLLRSEERRRRPDPNETQALTPSQVRAAVGGAESVAPESESRSEPDPEWADLGSDEPEGPPFRLEAEVLTARVPPGQSGVFVLSYDRTMETFVGRADSDLRETLSGMVGEYAYFHFEVVPSRKDRFDRECELFHRLGGDRGQLDNRDHPLPPPGPQLKCPVCVKR